MHISRVAIITTHPIQYNAPFFKYLSERRKVDVMVFYTWGQSEKIIFDPDFKTLRSWDVPLLEGYKFKFLKNIARNPGSHDFTGINNPEIIKEIQSWQPDFLLIYGWAFRSHLKVLYNFRNKIPIIFRGDSTLLNANSSPLFKRLLRRFYLKWVYSLIDYALYVGQENKKYYLNYGVQERKLCFGPHCVDNNRFAKNPGTIEKARDIRESLNIPNEGIIFLFAGKFQNQKNPLIIISAFKRLINNNFFLIMVGDGELRSEMIKLIGGHTRIFILPFQNQSKMPEIYQLCDVFLLPSISETWGLSINEAMASGKAIITSGKVGCAPDLIKDGYNGFVVEDNNENQLLEKMNKFFSRKIAKEFGERSISIIKNWNFGTLATVIENLCNKENNLNV